MDLYVSFCESFPCTYNWRQSHFFLKLVKKTWLSQKMVWSYRGRPEDSAKNQLNNRKFGLAHLRCYFERRYYFRRGLPDVPIIFINTASKDIVYMQNEVADIQCPVFGYLSDLTTVSKRFIKYPMIITVFKKHNPIQMSKSDRSVESVVTTLHFHRR
jgi:hypothetical protein